MKRHLLATTSILAFGVFASVAAMAQSETSETVTVTGSRIQRAGYEAPTPLTVTTAEILNTANPSGPGEALRQMPILSATLAPRGSTGSGGSGGTFLNLRNLGTNNTLVLVDGERFIAATTAGSVDITMIPTALIERVEVVTGGASAVYGSDAVTGVVNFILDNNFIGLKGSVAGGISTYGQNGETKLSLAAGTDFGGGHGHLVFASDLYRDEGVFSLIDTVNGQKSCQTIALPAGSATSQGFACDVRSAQGNFTGIISSPSKLANTTFDNNGNPIPFHLGTNVTSTTMVGGDGIKPEFLPGQEPARRGIFYGRASWDFGSDLTIYASADYAITNYDYQIGSYSLNLGNTAITVYQDNAYLAPSLKTFMQSNNIPSFKLNKYFANLPRTWIENDTNTLRFVAGAKGKVFGDWTWDAHLESGQADNIDNVLYDELLPNMQLASDAVVNPVNGEIVCRSALTDPTSACLPFNVMGNSGMQAPASGKGVDAVTDAQLDYLTGNDWRKTMIVEDDAAINLAGTPFTNWAGDVSFATGIEWRYESTSQYANPVGQQFNNITGINGPFRSANFLSQAGNYQVVEGYVETVVPLLRDLPLAKNVDFNGAARLTNYSTSGNAFTWKAGVTWDVTDEVRLRGTQSRDVRAPNLSELYAAQTNGHGVIIDYGSPGSPTDGNTVTLSEGNANLKPESGDTSTIGLVYQPQWLAGLQTSIDAYRINISGAIASIGAQLIVQECAQGDNAECPFVIRTATGDLLAVLGEPQNLESISTEGVDLEANYQFSLQDISDLNGMVTLHGLANYVGKYVTVEPGAVTYNVAGDDAHPEWRWTFQASYSNDPFSMFVQARYSGAGLFTKTLAASILPTMHVGGEILIDVNTAYDFPLGGGTASLFFNVTDLFNAIPPVYADGGGQGAYGSGQFDNLGRYFRSGIRFNF